MQAIQGTRFQIVILYFFCLIPLEKRKQDTDKLNPVEEILTRSCYLHSSLRSCFINIPRCECSIPCGEYNTTRAERKGDARQQLKK